jgi:NitT/TauT family transport system ATP-binding protein
MDIKLMDIWQKLHQTIVFITHNIVEAILLASRIYVMNTNPGRIVEVINVDFPYPRNMDILIDPKFIEYQNKIVDLIGELHLKEIK